MMCRRWPLIVDRIGAVADVVADRFVVVQLGVQLVEIGHFQVRAVADRARLRRQLAQQQPQQGGLARAVGADQPHAVAAHDQRGKIADDGPVAVGETQRLWPRSPAGRSDRPPGFPCGLRPAGRGGPRGLRAVASKARTRPSLRVRRAMIPVRIQTSSWASFLSNCGPLLGLGLQGRPPCAQDRSRSRTTNWSAGRGRGRECAWPACGGTSGRA